MLLIIKAMNLIRAYIIPFLVILTFGLALLAVSARIFLPDDMLAPAPAEESVESAMENS
jgi:hypothetical protein